MTIEQKSPVSAEVRPALGAHVFGCDDCQSVCPFNAGAHAANRGDGGSPFSPLERWEHTSLEVLLAIDDAQWTSLAAGSPLRRAGRVRAACSAAIVLANRREVSALPSLRQAAEHHDDATVRATAAWAIARMDAPR
jgi:epoxyqueuosine reductase